MSTVAERHDSDLKQSAKHLPLNGLVLRCVVFQNTQTEYTAECIDLDLMVRGKNPYEALRSLRHAIIGYLGVAFAGDPAGLVPRPSPFSHRARYHIFALRAALSIGGVGAKRTFLLCDWAPGPLIC